MIRPVLTLIIAAMVPELAPSAVSPRQLNKVSSALILDGGQPLKQLKVRGTPLNQTYGLGKTFGAKQKSTYSSLKHQALSTKNFRIQWTLLNLDSEKVLSKSLNAERNFYGASVSKVFVAASLLEKKRGLPTKRQLQQIADMIVVSSNTAWGSLQYQIGDSSQDRGKKYIQRFVEKMGYSNTQGFRGWLGREHGNEINALETARFLSDTYHKRFPGAQTLWSVMQATRTGDTKARRYLPKSMAIGGKTGTYRGRMVDPLSRKTYQANVHHHAIVFKHQGQQYALVILTDHSTDEEVAIIARGLLSEYLQLKEERNIGRREASID